MDRALEFGGRQGAQEVRRGLGIEGSKSSERYVLTYITVRKDFFIQVNKDW